MTDAFTADPPAGSNCSWGVSEAKMYFAGKLMRIAQMVLLPLLGALAACGGSSSSPPLPPPPQPLGTLAPANLTFGSTVVATSSFAQALTLTNNSTPVLTIKSITATGSFSETNNCPVSLSSNASCTINVTFVPTAIGTTAGSLSVADNASNSPQTSTLSGTGTPGFAMTGSMTTGRYLHTGTLLNDGSILIAGGLNDSGIAVASAELYDPTTGKFTATGSMNATRYRHTATLLNDGDVLITGGELSSSGPASPLASAELYDPTAGTFTSTGSMTASRVFHTATMLNSGKVLIAGGLSNGNAFLATAELYDPSSGTFTLTGSMNNAREEHTATLMNNGLALIAGGNDGSTGFMSAELYDPVTGIFSTTRNPNTARSGQTAVLLNDGDVLIAAGYVPGGSELASAELYDSGTSAFTYTGSMTTAREFQRASMLNDGTILITGGLGAAGSNTISNAELYDEVSAMFTFVGSSSPKYWHTSTLLNNGSVLLAGGNTLTPALCELYLPGVVTPAGLVSLTVTPAMPQLSPGATQRFIATGTFSDNSTQVLQSVIWSSSNQAAVAISNDASNPGVALAVAAGTSTITASAGSITGSTVVAVQ
jgi:hypothetical protein